jgi:hypothetical protein
MKIRTLENLNQRLTDDLIWRKKEIYDLKSLIETLYLDYIITGISR